MLAQAIVGYRNTISGCNEVGQLREVSGIDEKTFQAPAPLVSL